MTMSKIRAGNFDIDEYLIRISPPPWLDRLPQCVSHFLGYREHETPEPPDVFIWLWTWIGVFCGVATLEAVFGESVLHGPWRSRCCRRFCKPCRQGRVY